MPAIPSPLASLAIPAAACASLAYLNARWAVSNDWRIIYASAKARRHLAQCERRDRVNSFYALEEHASHPATADQEHIVYGARSWTFSQTYEIVLRYAGWLQTTHQVKPREVVAIDFMNCPQFIFLTLALLSLGAIPALINYNLTGKPLVHSIKVSSSRLLIVDPEVRSKITPEVVDELGSPSIRSGQQPLQIIYFEESLQSSLNYFPQFRAPNEARSGAVGSGTALLIYTSGTTGLSKPAIVSWYKIIVGGLFAAYWMGVRPSTSSNPDRWYTCMPLYHSSGFLLGYNLCLLSGTTFVLGHRFSNKTFWQDVRASNATVIQYVGEALRYLLAAPPLQDPANPGKNLDKDNKVRIAFGNGLRPDVWEKFKARFDVGTIAEFYSATEGASTCSKWNYSSNSFSSGAIGRDGLFLGLVLRSRTALVKVDYDSETPFRDPRTGLCEQVAPGDPGELLWQLDVNDIKDTYQGYFNNSNATESKVLRDVLKKGDAWYRCGDVMRRDHEGRWYFVDRIGDTYRWKSENVSTNEVSEVMGQHPHVLEANVYGVEVPGHDGRAGCVATIFELADSATAEPTDDVLQSVASHAMNSLPKYAVPVFLRLVRDIQTTGTNKQQKHVLRKEGVSPDSGSGEERIYWLRNGRYVPFERRNWQELQEGRLKL